MTVFNLAYLTLSGIAVRRSLAEMAALEGTYLCCSEEAVASPTKLSVSKPGPKSEMFHVDHNSGGRYHLRRGAESVETVKGRGEGKGKGKGKGGQ
ncbi:hypothetical protein N658DRAFT_341302 [Parathielavia hyrcaniae]|uniref:Uncharacterized protein n=1 Tax=Parathielavia hyrcaniae TaxID=113614 RepID=A0AAN6T3D8_9PEZI|nr:hypothetical protein N658DRAFT_341302 [Parathielavia hyrcaniae]